MKRPTHSVSSLLSILLLLAGLILPAAPALAEGPTECPEGYFLESYYIDHTSETPAHTACVPLPGFSSDEFPYGDDDGKFKVTWEGSVPLRANTYAFTVEAEATDLELSVDGAQLITGASPWPQTTQYPLTEDPHRLRLEYVHELPSDAYAAQLSWKPVSCGADEYELTYYRGTVGENDPAYRTCVAGAAGNWPAGQPEVYLGNVDWWARFEGSEVFKRGIYTFDLHAAGSGYLTVGENPRTPFSTASPQVRATLKGSNNIVLEFQHKASDTSNQVDLTYALTTCADGLWTSRYWGNTSGTGEPAFTGCEALPDYTWAEGQPGPWVGVVDPPEAFTARWVGKPSLSAGTYRFHVESDGGYQLTVGGREVLDSADSGMKSADVTIDADGLTDVEFHYSTAGTGNRRARLWWERLDEPEATPLRCPADTWLAEYSASRNTPADFATCEEQTVDWGTSLPAAWAGPGQHQIRWTADLMLPAGSYSFRTSTDAGNTATLRLNGHRVLNAEGGSASSKYELEQQAYRVEAAYYGTGSERVIPTAWTCLGDTARTAEEHDFAVSYFDGADPSGTPAYTEYQPLPLPDREPGGPLWGGASGSVRWEGKVTFPSSRYRFYGPDAGLRVMLKDASNTDLILDSWTAGSPNFVERELDGTYTMVLEYQVENGRLLPRFWWNGADTPRLTAYTFTGERQIRLTFDKALHPYRGPANESFFLYNANGDPLPINSVSVSGNTASVELGSTVMDGQTVTLSYFPNAGRTVMQDASAGAMVGDLSAGKPAAGGVGQPSVPVSGVAVSADGDPDVLLLTSGHNRWQIDLGEVYSLDRFRLELVPPAAIGSLTVDYSLDGKDSPDPPTLPINESTLIRDLTGTLARYITLTYIPAVPTDSLKITRFQVTGSPQGAAVGFIPALRFAHDKDGPVLETAQLNVDLILLTYDEPLDTRSVPQPEDYTVKVAGASHTPTSVVVQGETVMLYLPVSVSFGQAVTLTYKSGGNPVRDVLQHEASDLTNEPVDAVSAEMVNLASRTDATATQSSTAVDNDAANGAGRAVDGDRATASATKNEAGAWWQIDLGELSTLFDLRIYLPGDAAASPPKYRVMLSEGDDLWSLAYEHDSSAVGTYGLKIDLKGHKARKLRIESAASAQLRFAEIEIWGFPPKH